MHAPHILAHFVIAVRRSVPKHMRHTGFSSGFLLLRSIFFSFGMTKPRFTKRGADSLNYYPDAPQRMERLPGVVLLRRGCSSAPVHDANGLEEGFRLHASRLCGRSQPIAFTHGALTSIKVLAPSKYPLFSPQVGPRPPRDLKSGRRILPDINLLILEPPQRKEMLSADYVPVRISS